MSDNSGTSYNGSGRVFSKFEFSESSRIVEYNAVVRDCEGEIFLRSTR